MFRVVDDDIESPYKIVPEIFNFVNKVLSVFVICITLLTPHGGRHGVCCVTSKLMGSMSATPLLRAHMTS